VAGAFKASLGPSLEFVTKSATRMHHMLSAIQMVSRIDRAPMLSCACSVEKAVGQAAHELRSAMLEYSVSLEVRQLPLCKADPELLQQVFSYLLDNAIRFRSPQRPLRIEIFEKEQPQPQFARWTLIGIRDNGVGFEPSRSDRLFGLFYRENPSEQDNHMGVGLYMARRILWRLQGDVWAEGSLDEGATFWLALPPWRGDSV